MVLVSDVELRVTVIEGEVHTTPDGPQVAALSICRYTTGVTARIPLRFVMRDPASFLRMFRSDAFTSIDLDTVEISHVWALVGLCALARKNGVPPLTVKMNGASGAAKFAHAIGFSDAVENRVSTIPGEAGRTYKIRRVTRIDEIERAAREIAELIIPGDENEESQKTIRYVLVELLRNAVQHSDDPKGGVVAAQLMREGSSGYARPAVQVAIADAGIGLLAALNQSYPELSDPEAALIKALEPHVSGKFGPGRTGTAYNAGMGLFFIAEMAKLTAGRLLIASRGAALSLSGDLEGYAKHRLSVVEPRGLGFPGTLVAFELPLGEPADHDGLIEVIRAKAAERTPLRDTTPWVRFDAKPDGTASFLVSQVIEDVTAAARLSRESLQPSLFRREPVALDFRNVSVCTQSFLHALLYETIRISWAVQTPVFIENAAPGVIAGVRLVDNYARGG